MTFFLSVVIKDIDGEEGFSLDTLEEWGGLDLLCDNFLRVLPLLPLLLLVFVVVVIVVEVGVL